MTSWNRCKTCHKYTEGNGAPENFCNGHHASKLTPSRVKAKAKLGDMQEVFEQASAQVAMWPEWKRKWTSRHNDDPSEDLDANLNIPYVVAAIDKEIARLKARKKELLTKDKKRGKK